MNQERETPKFSGIADPKCLACKAEQAAPEMFECVASFVRKFGVAVECDEAINGGDAVDWITENMREFRNALSKARGLL